MRLCLLQSRFCLEKSAKNCPGRFARSIESEVSPLSVLVLILAVLTLIVLVLAVLLILLVSVLVLVVLILIVLVILVGHCFSSYGARLRKYPAFRRTDILLRGRGIIQESCANIIADRT
jgi:O-antigen ligase